MSPARRASSWGSMPYLTKPPSVPTIHQRGRSIRQIRLVSTWKSDVVELQDDPAVPAAVDALPGAGDQPGREPPARAQAELEGLVDQVRAPVVEDRARPPRRWPRQPRGGGVAADRALEEQRPADQPLCEHVLDGQEVPVPAPVVEDREHAARAVAGGDHPVGLGGRERHHLVDDAVLAGLERPDGQLGVACRAGVAITTSSTVGVGQGLVEVGVAAHVLAPERHGLGADLGVAGDDPVQPQARAGAGSADSGTPGPPGRGRRRPCRSCSSSSPAIAIRPSPDRPAPS